MGVTQYIGARYVPLFADPEEWTNTRTYEPLTIVLHEGNSFTSKQFVPVGIDINNGEFWAETGNYNAQVEAYRQEVLGFDGRISENANNISKYAYPKNNPIYYGADPTGVNDSSNAINECIIANKNGIVVFTPGTYLINNPIVTPQNRDERVSIDFNGSIINAASREEFALGIGFQSGTEEQAGLVRTFFKNGTLNNVGNCKCGIKTNLGYKDASISQMNIIGFETGISLGNSSNVKPIDSQITDCYLKFTDMSIESKGIEFNGSDSKINNCRIYGFKYAFYSYAVGNFIDNVHAFPQSSPTQEVLEETCFIIQPNSGGTNHIRNCYCDTLGTFLKYTRNGGTLNVDLVSNRMYSYRSDFKQTFVNALSSAAVFGNIKNNNITFNGTYDNQTIIMPQTDNLQHTFSNELSICDNLLGAEGGFSFKYGDIFTLTNKSAMQWRNTPRLEADDWIRICAIPVTRNNRVIDLTVTWPFSTPVTDKLGIVSIVTSNAVSISHYQTSQKTAQYKYGIDIDTETFSYPVLYLYAQRTSAGNIGTPITVESNIYGLTELPRLYNPLITKNVPMFIESN